MSNIRLLDDDMTSFDTALRRFFSPAIFTTETPDLKMRLDVSEKGEAYEVKADIPGVKKEDIHVRIDRNVVQIDAESKREAETKGDGDKILRSERHYGRISRSFSLAQDVDESKAEARYADGVLTLTLPKKTSSASRKIDVK